MSWLCVNPAHFVAEEKETYPDRDEKNLDRIENSLDWCDTRDLLGEIQAIDGHVQRGDDTVSPFRLFGIVFHGQDARWFGGCRLCGSVRTLIGMSVHRLVQPTHLVKSTASIRDRSS